MSVLEIRNKMNNIQNSLLEFLEEESDAEDKYENFINLIREEQLINDEYQIKSIIQLISDIGNNHQRNHTFISKIEKLLRYLKQDLQNYISNSDFFEYFKDNKRILLFLLEEKMMIFDENIFSRIISERFDNILNFKYFQPEIKPFLTKEIIEKYTNESVYLKSEKIIEEMRKEVEENFYEKRRKGENDNNLCQLIRNNEIVEFIKFVEQSNTSLNSYIKTSKYETNQLLIDNEEISLIEYASFYGSIDIIKYMKVKQTKLRKSMWIYAIHSRNAELIHFLEENHVLPPKKDYEMILRESIKCHHNAISDYIINNLIKEEDLQNSIENNFYDNFYRYAVEYHNYCFFPKDMKYKNMFLYLYRFKYYTLVKLYLTDGTIDIDINTRVKTITILNNIFKSKSFMAFKFNFFMKFENYFLLKFK